MIGLEVNLNGKRLCIAGADDLSVLSAILSIGGPLGTKTVQRHRNTDENPEASPVPTLHISGMTSRGEGEPNEHLRWVRDALISIGDTLELRFVNLTPGAADRPVVEAAPTESSERRRFLAAKAQYFALRDKFETPER